MNYCSVWISVKARKTDRQTDGQTNRQTESDAYEPTVQYAQVGSKKTKKKNKQNNTEVKTLSNILPMNNVVGHTSFYAKMDLVKFGVLY